MGGYVSGQDQDLDKALELWPEITNFLQQEENEICSFGDSKTGLLNLTVN